MNTKKKILATILLFIAVCSFSLYINSEIEAERDLSGEFATPASLAESSRMHGGGHQQDEDVSFPSVGSGGDSQILLADILGQHEADTGLSTYSSVSTVKGTVTYDGTSYLGEIKLCEDCTNGDVVANGESDAINHRVYLPEELIHWISDKKYEQDAWFSVSFPNKKMYSFKIENRHVQTNGDVILSGSLLGGAGWVSMICGGDEVKMQLFDDNCSALYNLFYLPEENVYNVRELRLVESINGGIAE